MRAVALILLIRKMGVQKIPKSCGHHMRTVSLTVACGRRQGQAKNADAFRPTDRRSIAAAPNLDKAIDKVHCISDIGTLLRDCCVEMNA